MVSLVRVVWMGKEGRLGSVAHHDVCQRDDVEGQWGRNQLRKKELIIVLKLQHKVEE